jgi:hypothetical protein
MDSTAFAIAIMAAGKECAKPLKQAHLASVAANTKKTTFQRKAV